MPTVEVSANRTAAVWVVLLLVNVRDARRR
jgi:hypothetical protein